MKRLTLLFLVGAFALVPAARADISNMDVGGDLFMMFFYGENTDDFNDSSVAGDDELDFLRTQAHVWFQADLEDNVMARISIEADRDWESAEVFNYNELDRHDSTDLGVFLEEAYVQIANVFDSSLSILAGRQFLNFGDNPEADDFNQYWGGSFWFGDGNAQSPVDIACLGTWETDPFDAIVLEFDLDTAIIDAFYGQAVDDPTGYDADLGFWGINASYIGWEGHQLDGYFLFTDGDFSDSVMVDGYTALIDGYEDGVYGDYYWDMRPGEMEHYLVGLRLAGDLIPDELSYKLEGAYNFGDLTDGGITHALNTSSSDGDFDGFGAEAGLNYHPYMDYNPEIGFIYTWLEGDEDNISPMDEDFDGILLPFENKYYGEIANSFVFTNCHIFHLTGGIDFNEQWSLDADGYYFLLDEEDGSTTQLSLESRGWGPADDDNLGFELDVQLNYMFNESVSTFGGGGVFWPGDAIDDMNGADDEAYFIRTGVKVAF